MLHSTPAVIFCNFERQMLGTLVYSITCPHVDSWDALFPQCEAAHEVIRTLPLPAFNPHAQKTFKVWWSAAHSAVPADAQNFASCNTTKEISNRIHAAAKWSLASNDL
jgi:hypothetical protein